MQPTHELDFRNMVIPFVGPRGSGKSYLAIRLLLKMHHLFDYICIFCPSLKHNTDYELFDPTTSEKRLDKLGIPPDWRLSKQERLKFRFYNNPNHELFDTLVGEQEQADLTAMETVRRNPDSSIRSPTTLFLCDDCLSTSLVRNPDLLNHIAQDGRHFNLALWILAQQLNKVPKTVRANADLFIYFCPYSIREGEEFFEQFSLARYRRRMMREISKIWDQKYQFVFVDNKHECIRNRLKFSTAEQFIQGRGQILDMGYMFDMASTKQQDLG